MGVGRPKTKREKKFCKTCGGLVSHRAVEFHPDSDAVKIWQCWICESEIVFSKDGLEFKRAGVNRKEIWK